MFTFIRQLATPAEIFLSRANKHIIGRLFCNHAKLSGRLLDISEVSISVPKYKTKDILNPLFDNIFQFMEIYIPFVGWFRINGTPKIQLNYLTGEYYKEFTAYSYETQLQDVSVSLFYVNMGTELSLEMYEENLDALGVPKRNIQFYIDNASDDPTSDKYWGLGLLNIIERDFCSTKGWRIGQVDTGLKGLRGRQFEIDSQDVYSFLMNDVAKAYKCIFIFDTFEKTINAYNIENFGKALNIECNRRNLLNSATITGQKDYAYTRFEVAGGSEETIISYVNFGSSYIENLSYYAPIHLPKETYNKYNAYVEYKESRRSDYADTIKEYLDLQATVDRLHQMIPIDECATHWDSYTTEELQTELSQFNELLKVLESTENIEYSKDYAIYLSIKDVIIPSIESILTARATNNDPVKVEYKLNWELYGIDELEIKLNHYQNLVDTYKDKGYDEEWKEGNSHSEATHNAHHEEYLKYLSYVAAINERLTQLKELADAYNIQIDELNTLRKSIAADVSMEHERFGLSEQELADIHSLYLDSGYTDQTIEFQDMDDIDAIIQQSYELLESAQKQLAIECRPQLTCTIDLENLFLINKYQKSLTGFHIGDFFYLDLSDHENYPLDKTKQRIIKLDMELVDLSDTAISLEFSDMINDSGKIADNEYLLGVNSSSSGTSLSKSASKYVTNTATTVASQVLGNYLSGGQSIFPNGISSEDLMKLSDALDGLINGTLSLDELKAQIAQIDSLEANSAFIKYINSQIIVSDFAEFKTLEAKLALIDELLAGNVSAELGHIIKLTADNVTIDEAVIRELIAAQILVSDLQAGDITLSDTMRILSENGSLVMNGETLQIMGTTSDGAQYVAIQLGYDSTNKPSLIICDETGAVMLDASGLHEAIMPEGFIKNNMISNGSISKDKLAFSTVEQNEDGSIDVKDVNINGEGVKAKFITIESSIKTTNEKIDNLSINSIDTVDVYYYLSSSPLELADGEWSTDYPGYVSGRYLWSKTVTTYSSGESTESDPACITGSDGEGVSISTTSVTYQKSTNGSDIPTGSWSETIPSVEAGGYLWTKTTVIYSDGNEIVSYGVSRNGINGENGDNGDNGLGIESIKEQYYQSSSATTLSDGSWVDTYPGSESGKYIWTRSVITYTDKTETTTDAVCVTGAKGDTGNGVLTTDVTYQVGISGTTPPTGTWNDNIPDTSAGQYLWTRTVTTYTDTSTSTSYSVSKMGETGRGIASITEEYAINEDKTIAPTDGWSTSQPEWSTGKYIWTRSKIVYKDPASTEYTSPVCSSEWEAAENVRNDLQEQITTNKTSIASVSSEVNNINKAIINMVTQDDITEAIDNYDGSTVETLRSRVTSTEQDISGIKTTVKDVQSTLIDKADVSTVQTLSDKVTTVETTVNGVKTTVQSNYTELRTDIDNMEIGGRNLLLGSNDLYSNLWKIYKDGTQTFTEIEGLLRGSTGVILDILEVSTGWAVLLYSLGDALKLLEPLTDYTLSFDIYPSSDVTLYYSIRDSDGANVISSYSNHVTCPSDCWTHFVATITTYQDLVLSNQGLYIQTINELGSYKLCNFKFEKGNKATDWTPAPEDVESEIMDANTGRDKWKLQIYPKSTLPDDLIEMVTVDFLSYSGVYPSNTYLIDDVQLSTSLPYSNYYIGYAITRINIEKSTAVNTTFSIKSSGLLYVNNIITEPDSNGNVSFTLLPGWNTLEVVWNVSDTDVTGGFQFGTHLSKLSACSLMNCLYESVTANITNSIQKNAELQVTVGAIQTQISEINSEIVQKADGSVMTEIQERLTESISDLNGFKQTVSETYISNTYKTEVSSQFAQMLEEINMKVSTAEMEAAIALTKNQWRIDFAENGASCGYFSVNKNGITVAGEDGSGYKTVMSSTEFAGYFNNSRVFWLNQDETVSMRLRVDKGIDLRTIKLIPVTQDEYRGLDFLGGNAII